jgi:hypothetical protein
MFVYTEPPMSRDKYRKVNFLCSLLLPIAISIVIFYLLYVFFLSHIWGDQAFLLYAAKEVLAGVKLDGSRLIVVNPPLIVWFSAIPVAISQVLHVSPVLALRVITLFLVSASTVWSARLLRIGGIGAALGVPYLLVAALVGVAELTIQPAMFGQREQFVVALLMPCVLAVSTGAIKSLTITERCAIGFCAGLGVCFKPQQVSTLICLELFLLVYRRGLRHLVSVELLVSVLTGIVYVVGVWAFTPYFSAIVPLLLDTYWAFGQHTWSGMLLHDARLLTAVLLTAVIGWRSLRPRMCAPMLAGALLACSAGSLIAFYLQHTGWSYQAFPARAFLFVAIVTIALDSIGVRYGQSFRYGRPRKAAWVGAVAISVTAFAGAAAIRKWVDTRHGHPKIYTELASYPPGTAVYVFSVEMLQFPLLLDRQFVWASRFEDLWMLPAIIQNETSRKDRSRPFKASSSERTEELAAIQRNSTTEDLQIWKPKYVFVQRCAGDPPCEIFNHPVDFISWFSKSPLFAAEWTKYRFEKTLDNVDVYVRN